MTKTLNIELEDAEFKVASTLKSIMGVGWKEFLMTLVNDEIERRKLNEVPIFREESS